MAFPEGAVILAGDPMPDISRLQALAEAGDADTQYKLGLCCELGLNVDEDAAQTTI